MARDPNAHDPNQPPRQDPAYTEPRIPPPPEKPGSGIGTDPERPTSPGTPRSSKAEDIAKQQKDVDEAAAQLQPTGSFDPLAKGTPKEQAEAKEQREKDEAEEQRRLQPTGDGVLEGTPRPELRPAVVNRPVGAAAEAKFAKDNNAPRNDDKAANDKDNK